VKKLVMLGLVLVLLVSLVGLGAGWKSKRGRTLCLTDEYLRSVDFAMVQYGPGSLDSYLDTKYCYVGFALSGLECKGTGIGDDWWNGPTLGPSALSGLGEHPDHPDFYTVATRYKQISLCVENYAYDDVDVCIYMNTGFTDGGWSADYDPSMTTAEEDALDTFWQSKWVTIPGGKERKVTLKFRKAIAYNISDDPVYTGRTDGNTYAIERLDEVSHIGIQVADCKTGGPTKTWLIVGCPGGKSKQGPVPVK
jgi:hypothetical protein